MTREPETPAPSNETPLQGWKEIAAHLDRDQRTARRWELEEALPIYRHRTSGRSSVYAFASELDAWRAQRAVKDEPEPERPWLRRLAPVGAAAAFAVTAWLIVRGPILNPESPLVEAADPVGVTARRVWYGDMTDAFGSLSPDGKRIAFNEWADGNIGIHDLETGEDATLLPPVRWDKGQSAMFPVLSPDGEEVAYVWYDPETEPEGTEVRIVAVDGRNVRTVYSNPEQRHANPVDWFPDGKRLLLNVELLDKTNQLAILSLSTGQAEPLVTLGWKREGFFRVSPNGRWIAYEKDDDVHVIAADGSRQTVIAPSPANDSVMDWTPDGRKLLISSDRTGSEGLWAIEIIDGRPAGKPELVRAQLSTISSIGLAKNGTLYYGVRSGRSQILVGSWDLETGRALEPLRDLIRSYVGPHGSPSWSPDGRSIAFVERYNRLHVENVETGEGRVLGEDLGFTRRTDWSPDGRSILLQSYGDNRGRGIYVGDVRSGKLELILKQTEDFHVSDPRWAPDGKSFYCRKTLTDSDSAAVRFDLATQEEQTILEKAYYVSASRPDGRLAMCVLLEGEERGLVVTDSEGKGLRQIYRVGSADDLAYPEWTPDGRFILFWRIRNHRPDATQGRRELLRIPATGGEAVQLPLEVEGLAGVEISIHPDGKRIAIPVNTTSQEVWALENFLPAGASD